MHKVCKIFYYDKIIIILMNMNIIIKKNTVLRLKQCFIGIFVLFLISPRKKNMYEITESFQLFFNIQLQI